MSNRNFDIHSSKTNNSLIKRHPIITNMLIIVAITVIGLCIAYLSLAVFTKHGSYDTVPSVENLSYTQAIDKLHDYGFRTEIRDSVFRDDVRPGFVVEQFPKSGAIVKPGRKIFLYINSVHPKEVVIDEDGNASDDALRSFSLRQGIARLEELGFKNIKIVKVLGDNDCIVKVTANGNTVKKTQKIPVNASIVVMVYDGRLNALRDSLENEEYSLQNAYNLNYDENQIESDEFDNNASEDSDISYIGE